MGLLDDLAKPAKVWPCKVRDTAANLEPADAKILLDAVMDTEWQYSTLQNELAKRDIQIGQAQIKAHRSGRCSCSKI